MKSKQETYMSRTRKPSEERRVSPVGVLEEADGRKLLLLLVAYSVYVSERTAKPEARCFCRSYEQRNYLSGDYHSHSLYEFGLGVKIILRDAEKHGGALG